MRFARLLVVSAAALAAPAIAHAAPVAAGDYAAVLTDARSNTGDDNAIFSQTAWLLTQTRNGMLADDTSSDVMADVLQQVIWRFDDELGPARRNDNAFVYLANRAEQDFFSGIAGERVVDLFPPNAQEAQDRQVLQVPGPSALTWLVPGLAALVFMRRRVSPHA